jgi:SAM-dependent methyltransferase
MAMIKQVNLALSDFRRRIEADRVLVRRIKRALRWIGYDATHLIRVVPYENCFKWVEDRNPQHLDVLEIGSGEVWRSRFSFKSYTTFNYPEHDICRDRLEREFDLVIADNVFEHLAWPYRAARNVIAMVKPGGWFLNLTPFLIRIHDVPIDCTRWTETGIRYFLTEVGFDPATMHSGSWGNRKAVIANFKRLGTYRGWSRKLTNEPQFPAIVWVMAQRPMEESEAIGNRPR